MECDSGFQNATQDCYFLQTLTLITAFVLHSSSPTFPRSAFTSPRTDLAAMRRSWLP